MSTASTSLTISSGGYTAEISTIGGQLLSLTSDDDAGHAQNLIVPAANAPGGYAGAVLLPWPNRVAKAQYKHGGQQYQLSANEEETGAALHGLFTDTQLQVLSHKPGELSLSGVLEPSDSYPWRLHVSLIYRVSRVWGLSLGLAIRHEPTDDNTDSYAPVGVGFHPYLTAADAPLRSCRLELPASTITFTTADGAVVDRAPVSGDFDLQEGPLLAGLSIDHAYTGLPKDAWSATLRHGPSGLVVRMISDTRWAQVFTGENINRIGVAVEPMTCPPNALNSGEDLQYLAAGQVLRTGFSIEAIRR